MGCARFCERDPGYPNLAAIRQSAEIETSLANQLKQRVVHHTAWSPGSLCSLVKAVQDSEFSKENKDSLLLALDGLECGTVQAAAASKLAVCSRSRITSPKKIGRFWMALAVGMRQFAWPKGFEAWA